MEYRNSRIYGSLRFKPCFREEVNKFLEAAEKDAMSTKNNTEIICQCSDCKNQLAWKDVTIIVSHLIMRGSVKDYTVWIHHGHIWTCGYNVLNYICIYMFQS
jgi:hypothetical protein